MMYGTQVDLSLAPKLSLVGNIGYTTSDIKVGIPILGGVSVGHSSMLIYDAGLEYNFGCDDGARDADRAIHSGGRRRDSLRHRRVGDQHTGDEFRRQRRRRRRLHARAAASRCGSSAKDYIGKFNFQDATGLGISGNTAHNFALSAGLRFDF